MRIVRHLVAARQNYDACRAKATREFEQMSEQRRRKAAVELTQTHPATGDPLDRVVSELLGVSYEDFASHRCRREETELDIMAITVDLKHPQSKD